MRFLGHSRPLLKEEVEEELEEDEEEDDGHVSTREERTL